MMNILDFLNELEHDEIPMSQFESQAYDEARVEFTFKDISKI